MNKPNFLVLGAAKSGTTSLYHCLNQHPDICMSMPKEPRYFEKEYGNGIDFYWEKYFSHYKNETKIGEARAVHLYLPYVPERIYETIPDAKLLVILRHPIERAISLWWELYRNKLEPLYFDEAIAENKKRLQESIFFEGEMGEKIWLGDSSKYFGSKSRHRIYMDMGYYAEQLQRYYDLFPKENIKVLLLEDFSANQQAVMNEVFCFLGVSPMELKDTTPQRVGLTTGQHYFRKLRKKHRIYKRLPKKLMLKLLGKWSRSKPKIDSTTREWLVAHYREHNLQLQNLLNRDLSHWNS